MKGACWDPTYEQIKACSEWLDLELRLVCPKVIATLGVPALQRFFPGESISSFRMKGKSRERGGLIYFPLYHPTAWARWSEELRAEERPTLIELRQLLKKLSLS